MVPNPLTPCQQNILQHASRSAIVQLFQSNNDFTNRNWLPSTNRYLCNTTNQIQDDIKKGSLQAVDIASYIALSAPLHCLDGWTYLSKALLCLIQGDTSTARHLGYYAELRATISLLATEGIGIFNSHHFVVDAYGNCRELPKSKRADGSRYRAGTHEIVWLALEYWSSRPQAVQLIGNVIKPFGVNLDNWHQFFTPGSNLPAIAPTWLSGWGLDLKRLSTDHVTRNELSYQPFRFVSIPSVIPQESCKFFREFWTLFSPSGISRFDNLDQYLLRKSLRIAYTAFPSARTPGGGTSYDDRVDYTVMQILKGKPLKLIYATKEFLLKPNDPDLINDSDLSTSPSDSRNVFQVLSRASLLLRLATGSNADLLANSGFSKSDLDFWWTMFGTDIGIWEPNDYPVVFEDLWADVDVSLNEINAWESKLPNFSTCELRENQAKNFWMLSSTEKIGLWGIMK